MRLLVPVSVFPDEHLPAAITRAAALNGRIQPSEIVTQAGLQYVRAETLPGQDPATAVRIADVLGADPTTVASGYHPRLDDGTIKFFGTTIRFRHLVAQRRRIAPAAFAKRGYIRALWQVRPLPFDSTTLEKTISTCPVCHSNLGYRKTLGLWACEACAGLDEFGLPTPKVDLRDFPQPILNVDDREALDFVTSLIDPDPVVRAKPTQPLHNELGALSRGELFEAAAALVCVADQDTSRTATSVARPKFDAEFETLFTPDAVATAGRALLNWPNGFDEMCERARKDLTARGHHGVKAELGQIYALIREKTISETTRTMFMEAIRRYMASGPARAMTSAYRADSDLRTSTKLQSIFGISARTLARLLSDPRVESYSTTTSSGPKLFRLQQIAEIVDQKQFAEVASSVGLRLGISLEEVAKLADASLIDRDTGPAVKLLKSDATYYDRRSVDRLILRLEKLATGRVSTNTPAVRLTRAMTRLEGPEKPWVEVINAILKRKLRVVAVDGRLDAILIKLAAESLDAIIAVLPASYSQKHAEIELTQTEISAILDVSTGMVKLLIDAGELPPRGTTRANVQAVAERVVFVRELAEHLGTKSLRHVRAFMEALGVSPYYEGGTRGLLFNRVEAMAALRNRHLVEEKV